MPQKIIADLKKLIDPEKATFFPKFFDTHTTQTEKFLGVTVPNTRLIAKKYKDASLTDTLELLQNDYHEVRLLALMMLSNKFAKADESERKKIVNLYLENTKYVNNWDLVDTSCYNILGIYLLDKPRDLLYKLAKSEDLWEQRIAIVSTMAFIRKGQIDDTYKISEMLLGHKNHYIHKAVGWLLREAGKKDTAKLEAFLQKHYKNIPRTALRYAIEKFDEKKRKIYINNLKD